MWEVKSLEEHFIPSLEEFRELREIALAEIGDGSDDLDNATALSAFCRRSIKNVSTKQKDIKWYYASPFKTLKKFGIGNCKNYAESLIALSYTVGIDGRKIYIVGIVDAEGNRPRTEQGHVLCELKINGRWVIFDAIYGVPDIGEVMKHKLKEKTFRLPRAYDCWKNPDRYITLIKPECRGFSKMFWTQIWDDFLVKGQPTIKGMGEKSFVKKWYGETLK